LQQREQFILNKLTEAREAQASAMTRFIHARARLMQVEAHLPALRASISASLTEQTSVSAASLTNSQDAPALAPELSVLLDESGLAALARALDVAPESDSVTPDMPDTLVVIPSAPDVPGLPPTLETAPDTLAVIPPDPDVPGLPPALETAPDVLAMIPPDPDVPDLPPTLETAPDTLVVIPSAPDVPVVIPETEESEDEEETKKQPAIQLPRPPAQLAQPTPEEEETLLVSMSELLKAREARQAAAGDQDRAV
jgi:hypothetical protein